MAKSTIKKVVSAVASLLLLAGLYACSSQQQARAAEQDMSNPPQSMQQTAMANRGDIISAKHLLDMDVRNSSNEKIGEVKDVVLDPSRTHIDYVVLAAGGMMGVHEKLFAVPWTSFDTRDLTKDSKSLTLNIPADRFAKASGFDRNAWPDRGDPQWTPEGMAPMAAVPQSMDFLNDPGYFKTYGFQSSEMPAPEKAAPQAVPQGSMAKPESKEYVTAHGRMYPSAETPYNFGYRNFEDYGYAPPPEVSAYQEPISSDQSVGAKPAQLWDRRVSKLDGIEMKNLSDQKVGTIGDIMIDAHTGAVAFALVNSGGVLGFGGRVAVVPWSITSINVADHFARLTTDQQKLDATTYAYGKLPDLSDRQVARNIYDQFGETPYWQAYGYAAPSEVRGGGYADQFQKAPVTISGKVEGTFEATSSEGPITVLKVAADDGRHLQVHLAPQDFINSKGLSFANGDKVTITAAEISREDRSLYAATNIEKGVTKVALRDQNGTPLWSANMPPEKPGASPMEPPAGKSAPAPMEQPPVTSTP